MSRAGLEVCDFGAGFPRVSGDEPYREPAEKEA